ncbi:MAG TPA: hypothetical protein VK190_03450 [Pseudoneobacillus sp.]|nr:hypothetical protein [Pseudoneobacillus sp.]
MAKKKKELTEEEQVVLEQRKIAEKWYDILTFVELPIKVKLHNGKTCDVVYVARHGSGIPFMHVDNYDGLNGIRFNPIHIKEIVKEEVTTQGG